MSLFFLVHGSTQNASGWARLVPELQRQGHGVICVNLPTDEPEPSGTRYAQVIAEALRNSTEAPIVVAHSVSGVFLTLLPNYCPRIEDRVSCSFKLEGDRMAIRDGKTWGVSWNVCADLAILRTPVELRVGTTSSNVFGNGVAHASFSFSLRKASFSLSLSGHRTLVDRLRPCARRGERA